MKLKCLHYNYNDTETTCTHSYEKCAKEVNCPEDEDEHHCFVVWKVENTNVSTPISSGCNRNYQHAAKEICGNQCIGIPKGPRYYCCCSNDLCNSNFTLPNKPETTTFTSTPQTNLPSQPTTSSYSVLLSCIPIILIILIICAYVFRKWIFKCLGENENNRRANHNRNLTPNELNELGNNHTLSILTPFRKAFRVSCEADDDYLSNGNRQQLPLNNHQQQVFSNPNQKLTNHNDANQQMHNLNLNSITLLEVIGSGRFGTVHRAKIKQASIAVNVDNNSNTNDSNTNNEIEQDDEESMVEALEGSGKVKKSQLNEIAVKIILASDHQSWLNEQQVYNLPKLKHKNILNFISSDEHLETESYWLVVEYASKGSLYNYIKENLITWKEFNHISIGIVHGLAHLHEVEIAHRDFKSKNVLLRHDLTPCITDFGVAAILDTTQGSQLDSRKKYLQVGTPRYMAPEVLECSVTFTKSSFTKIDVYALSLVLWELLSRCYPMYNECNQTNPKNVTPVQPLPGPYKMPFEDEAGLQPDINQMRQIVVVRKKRPVLKNEWRLYPVSEFCRAIEDGWEYDCDARISASCFVERVDSVLEESR